MCFMRGVASDLSCLQAFVVVGDSNGHVGLGVKCAKEVRQRALRLQSSSSWDSDSQRNSRHS